MASHADPGADPRKFVVVARSDHLPTFASGQESLDTAQQIVRVHRLQLVGIGDAAGYQNARVVGTQVRHAADEPGLGLPGANRLRGDRHVGQLGGGRLGCQGEQIGDLCHADRSQLLGHSPTDRRGVLNRAGCLQIELPLGRRLGVPHDPLPPVERAVGRSVKQFGHVTPRFAPGPFHDLRAAQQSPATLLLRVPRLSFFDNNSVSQLAGKLFRIPIGSVDNNTRPSNRGSRHWGSRHWGSRHWGSGVVRRVSCLGRSNFPSPFGRTLNDQVANRMIPLAQQLRGHRIASEQQHLTIFLGEVRNNFQHFRMLLNIHVQEGIVQNQRHLDATPSVYGGDGHADTQVNLIVSLRSEHVVRIDLAVARCDPEQAILR